MKKLVVIMLIGALSTIVAGCSSSRKKTETEPTPVGGSESNAKVETTPISFSPSGSDSGSIEGLQTVRFEYDKSTLTPSELAKLRSNAEWMKKNSKVVLTIEGHCDQKGSNEYNLSLGERRANAVKNLLSTEGVPSNRLTTVSFGEEKPLDSAETEAAMAKNRRANFVPAN